MVLADGSQVTRQRRRELGSVLGDPRRRRQLRRRHLVHVPAAPGRQRGRRPDVLAAGAVGRGAARLPRVHPAAPRELNGFFAFLTVPPGPPFPEELHGRKVCGIVWCYNGSAEDAAKAMAPMLEVGTPLHARRRRGAAPGDAGRVRRALPEGRPVVLAGRLRARAVRRGDRRARQVGREDAGRAVDHAPLPDRRRGARRVRHRHAVQPTATCSGPR